MYGRQGTLFEQLKALSRATAALVGVASLSACSSTLPGDEPSQRSDAPTEHATAETVAPLTGSTPDVVFSRAEVADGWRGDNTISAELGGQIQGAANLHAVGRGTTRFRHNSLGPVDVRNMRYLTFWYYVDDVSKIRTDQGAQVEIGSSSSIDTQELNWSVHGLNLRNGWNFVRLELSAGRAENIDLAAVKRFRLYHFVSGTVTTRIDDIRFSNRTSSSFASGCGNAFSFRTFTGDAAFKRGSGYSANGCTDAYVVDFYDYAPQNDYGTSIAYNDTAPTTQAACEAASLTVGVWECTPGTSSAACDPNQSGRARAFLGEATVRGVWVRDPANQGICKKPHLVLEHHVPEYRPNGVRDYKLAIRVQSGATKQRPIALATTNVVLPDVQAIDTFHSELSALTGGAIHPVIHEVWSLRGTPEGDHVCRTHRLERPLLSFGARSYQQAGARSSAVATTRTANLAAFNAYCGGGTEAAFQAATRDVLGAMIQIRQDLAARFLQLGGALGSPWNDTQRLGTMLMGQIRRFNLGLLLSNCNLSIESIYRYEELGTLPAGVAPEQLLLGSCRNETPEGLASRLGVGGSLSPATAQSRLHECLAPSGRDACNDPRAHSELDPVDLGPSPQENCLVGIEPCDTSEIEEWLDEKAEGDRQDAILDAIAEKMADKLIEKLGLNPAEAKAKTQQDQSGRVELDNLCDNLEGGVRRTCVELDKDANASASGKVPFWNTVKQLAEEAINFLNGLKFEAKEQPEGCREYSCHYAPKDNAGPNDYCPPDWVDAGWYATSNSRFSDGTSEPPINQKDRIEHCLCNSLDPAYVATGTPSARTSVMCPSKREKVAHHCLEAQWGPDDPIPAECLNDLQPEHVDNREWTARICQQIQCPDDQVPTVDIDRCECKSRPPVIGDPAGLRCAELGKVIRCEEGTTCVCGEKGYGDLPFNDPGCLQDPTTFPGSLERITTPTPERVFVFTDPRTPDDRFLALRDDSPTASRLVSAVLPPLHRSATTAVGTGVSTRVITTEAMTSGVLQLYLHNPENSVHHEFAAQCELRTFLAGEPGTCNLTPSTTQQRNRWDACLFDGGCAMEFTLQATPASYDGAVGFTAPTFIGQMSPTSGVLPPRCPRPAPLRDYYIRSVNTLWQNLGGTPQTPDINLLLGSGQNAPVVPTLPKLNPDILITRLLQ